MRGILAAWPDALDGNVFYECLDSAPKFHNQGLNLLSPKPRYGSVSIKTVGGTARQCTPITLRMALR